MPREEKIPRDLHEDAIGPPHCVRRAALAPPRASEWHCRRLRTVKVDVDSYAVQIVFNFEMDLVKLEAADSAA
jgi:hypothetical protein